MTIVKDSPAASLRSDSSSAELESWAREHLAQPVRELLNPDARARDREASCIPRELFEVCASLGLLAYLLPPSLGGLGGTRRTFGLLLEQIGRLCDGVEFPSLLSLYGDLPNVLATASSEVIERYVRPAASGEVLLGFAYTERGDSYDFETRSRRRGDRWLLSGRKVAQTGGAIADAFLVYVRDPSDRLQAFIVDRDTPGLTLEPVETLGFRAGGMTAMTLDEVELSDHQLVVEADGLGHVQTFLNARRVFICSAWPGQMQTLLDQLVDFLQHRIRQGQPLAQMQSVQSKLGQMYVRTQTARAVLHDALERMGRDEHERVFDPVLTAAKYTIVENAIAFGQDAIRLTGWAGYTDELPFQRALRGFMGGVAGQTPQELVQILLGQATVADVDIRRLLAQR